MKNYATRGAALFKKIVLIILCLACMASITYFSSQDAQESTKLSENVTEKIISQSKQYQKLDSAEQKKAVKKENDKVRNLAHFSLFLVLGILVYSALNEFFTAKTILIALAFCILYALFDETYQKLLNNGRAFEWADILKDSLGSVTGIALVFVKNLAVKKFIYR